MAEPARPHLHLVDGNGEARPVCPDCVVKDQEKTRLTRSYEGTIRTLKAQLAAEVEDDKQVRMVLTYFSRLAVETGWWKQTPQWSPGDERWAATAARLRSGRSVADCFVAIRGALEQDKRRTKRAYVDLTSVFRNNSNFERAFEQACDPGLDRVQTLQKRLRSALPESLRGREREVEEAGDFCTCFMGEERFLTPDGPRAFADTEGLTQTVLTRQGWREAEIKSFGTREVQLVQFGPGQIDRGERSIRSNWQRGVAVTPEHPWILVDGSVTTSLSVGDSIPAVTAPIRRNGDEYERGLRHGLVFGDGYHAGSRMRDGTQRYVLEFHSERVAQHTGIFDNFRVFPSRMRKRGVSYRGTGTVFAEEDLKAHPTSLEPEQLAGFVDGWLAADGTKRGETWKVVSISWDALDWLWDVAPLAGYIATGRGQERNVKTNKGHRTRPLRWVTLRAQPTIWRVRDVQPLGRAEVFCAVVPDLHEFVLAGGLLTHNCGHVRWDHDKPRPLEGILDPPCAECGCEGFSLDFVDPVRWARGRMGQ